ncbi:hypothetical protein XFEB_01515 [Xylella fastidiosa EB92.1]|nr:hypothetical protein XFEB_01515 [Xylella fastidiosa EB92.1]
MQMGPGNRNAGIEHHHSKITAPFNVQHGVPTYPHTLALNQETNNLNSSTRLSYHHGPSEVAANTRRREYHP